jgi:phosphoglycolate phosphatase-like HAD superfamily hydrolase
MLIKAIIVDLDGTLCDVEHRVHHVQGPNKDWQQFNQLLVHDTLNNWCMELIEAMSARDYKIIFVTGRGEGNRISTEEWLARHNIMYEHLYMRALLDQREDGDVKEDIYREFIQNKYHVLFVVDDRKSVVDRWREMKLVCLQCAPGNF